MIPRSAYIPILLLLTGVISPGCHQGLFDHQLWETGFSEQETAQATDYKQLTYEPSYPSAQKYASWAPDSCEVDNLQIDEPWSLQRDLPNEYLDLTLEQALLIALQNATILNDLGGTILTAPSTLHAIHDPAVVETDPRFGVEAALSQFDARLRSIGVFEKNDRPFNNFFVGGGTQLFQQDLHDYTFELTKKTASGTQFSARNLYDYNANNRSQNLFPSAWNTQIEMEVRQPLLQGAGVEFNRVAGPYGRPGVLDGIVIARINTDIAVTDFEMGLRDFISNVENAYWDLFYAYRLLDTALDARDQSLKTWKSTISRIDQKGITAAKEAQAREQYFRFEEEMKNALAGRVLNSTQTRNGSQAGTFVGTGGLYVAERRLRLLLGLPLKDEAVIRPVSEPKVAPVDYHWQTLVHEAVSQRPELKKQRQILKSLELQKDASQEFKKPRLDAFGRYRFRGFGDRLIGSTNATSTTLTQGAVEDLFGGQFQEWEMGIEMTLPIGFRQGHAAVRNLEIQIARERALLNQQERQIVHDLSNALAELHRVQEMTEISYNRLISAQQRFSSLNEDTDSPDEILDAQVRLAEAKSNYYRSLVEHEAALRNIHYEKGTLLPFRNVLLADQFSEENDSHWQMSEINSNTIERVSSETTPATGPEPESDHLEPEDPEADHPEVDPVAFEQPAEESPFEELPEKTAPTADPVGHQPEQTSFKHVPPPAPVPLEEAFVEKPQPATRRHVQSAQNSAADLPLPQLAPVAEAFGENPPPAGPRDDPAGQSSDMSLPTPSATIRSVQSSNERRPSEYRKAYQVQFVPKTQQPARQNVPLPQAPIRGDDWQHAD